MTTATTAEPTQESAKEENYVAPFAFWLPLDMKYTEELKENWKQRYIHSQFVYERCFGPGSWGDASFIHEMMSSRLMYDLEEMNEGMS